MSKQHDHSLSEVHASVDINKRRPGIRRVLAFLGPAYMISVGYMDPGNWATDLAGGSQFGYTLIWVLLMSNLMAVLLQTLSARLGIVRGLDLAQANRETYPRSVNFLLYILAEVAIAATDLAEVLGMALGIQLLTGLPLMWGVTITVLDTFLLLFLQHMGIRKMEAFIIALVAIIGVSFFAEIVLAQPHISDIAGGFVPRIPNDAALFIAIGIIGATVMPHNLYLHSALVQTRKIDKTKTGIKQALKWNFIDSTIALNIAFLVNASILILAATVFFKSGNTQVAQIKEAHQMLAPLLGSSLAPILFAVALIAAGQSSTITGTLAGQIVMEGYLRLRINPWVRRLLTRLLAIIPALFVIQSFGEDKLDSLLVFSQVILSLQLSFAIIPLIHFVSDKKTMGDFAIKTPVKILAWMVAAILVFLNIKMVINELGHFLESGHSIWILLLLVAVCLLFIALLGFTIFYPFLKEKTAVHEIGVHTEPVEEKIISIPEVKQFGTIAIALDFGEADEKLISHALAQGNKSSSYILIHVVESVSASLLKSESDDFESRKDDERLQLYVKLLKEKGYQTEGILGFNKPSAEIVRIVKESNSDLLVMGAHRHKGFKDYLFGETIESVRHELEIPVLIVNV